MYCKKCGAQINDGEKFCGSCGTAVTPQESRAIVTSKAQMRNSKAGILAAIAIGVVVIIGAVLIFSTLAKPDYDKYEEALKVCCNAINKRDKKLLDDVIYDKLGEDWNDEYVYETVDAFYEQQEDGEKYKKLTSDVENYKHYTSSYDLEDLKDFIFDRTGTIVDVVEAYELEMKHESYMEIALIKVEKRWYVLYLDL